MNITRPRVRNLPLPTPMIRAILSDVKTQIHQEFKGTMRPCIFGVAGHRLRVKEDFVVESWDIEDSDVSIRYVADNKNIIYSAKQDEFSTLVQSQCGRLLKSGAKEVRSYAGGDAYLRLPEGASAPVTPAHLLPNWASRITLEILETKILKLHDLSDKDILSSGIGEEMEGQTGYRHAYADMWDKKYGVGAWSKNPLIWQVLLKRVLV